jgi:hypothetical protein
MKRRDFIALVGEWRFARPIGALAQRQRSVHAAHCCSPRYPRMMRNNCIGLYGLVT